jgi:8-oxo-dGTP diphosphatase
VHFKEYDTRLAAYALIVEDGQVLLTWFVGNENAVACWSMPGGGVEYDESVQDAVVREVFEETGYTVELGGPLNVHSFTDPAPGRDRRPYKSVRIFFAATVTGGSLGTTEVGGTTEYAQWIPVAEVPTLSPRADIVDVALGLSDK